MKSVMKKLFSLLLVGVVTVSMFSFITPNCVNAKVQDSPLYFTVTMDHFSKRYKNTTCTITFINDRGEETHGSVMSNPKNLPEQTKQFNLRFDTRQIRFEVEALGTDEGIFTAVVDYDFTPRGGLSKKQVLNVKVWDGRRLNIGIKSPYFIVSHYGE